MTQDVYELLRDEYINLLNKLNLIDECMKFNTNDINKHEKYKLQKYKINKLIIYHPLNYTY